MRTDLTAREHNRVRALLACAATAHNRIDLDDPADYWYRLGQRNAHAVAAGLMLTDDTVEAEHVADRITRHLSASPTPAGVDDLYAAAQAPSTVVSGPVPALRWLEPKAWAAAHHDPDALDIPYRGHWGPNQDLVLTWRHRPHHDAGLLFVHDQTWDEYAVLAQDVDSRDVDAAYEAARRSQLPVTAETFSALLPSRQPQLPTAAGQGPCTAVDEPAHTLGVVDGASMELGR